MKLDNRGFAVTAFMYMILVLAIILILATLAILSSRRTILDKQKNTAIENITQANKKICKAVNGVRSLALGTKYECKVNDTETFNFYVLSKEGDKVNLIMDRNICEDGTTDYENDPDSNYCRYAWHADENDNNYGPDTVMTVMYNATKNWINIPDMIMNYSDENNSGSSTIGYTSIKTDIGTKVTTITGKQSKTSEYQTIGNLEEPLKARLPKLGELTNSGCHIYSIDEDNGTCPAWVVQNMSVSAYYPDNENIDHVYGYWVLSSYPGYALNANRVSLDGVIGNHHTSISNEKGIRPVITVYKSNLSY